MVSRTASRAVCGAVDCLSRSIGDRHIHELEISQYVTMMQQFGDGDFDQTIAMISDVSPLVAGIVLRQRCYDVCGLHPRYNQNPANKLRPSHRQRCGNQRPSLLHNFLRSFPLHRSSRPKGGKATCDPICWRAAQAAIHGFEHSATLAYRCENHEQRDR